MNPKKYSTFVLPYMLQHLSLFKNLADYPLLPLVHPSFRQSVIYDKTLSIWEVILTTMDYFNNTLDEPLQGPIPLQTVLNLPLHTVLNAPPDHWSHRHPRFLTASMFIFDRQADRLRFKVDGEYTCYPRLCHQLFSDILTNWTITLKEFVWDHILQEPSSLVPIIHTEPPLLTEVRLSTSWSRFTPQAYRLAYQDVHISPHKFQKATIRHFLYSKSYPNARTVFYRTIHHRIPTQVFIY
ncbi:hypothetical protein G6F43_012304 [Rhizopus delemar]|nr:hypothetical protein G6F43_012304 [Rhizopus delemar]